MNKSIVGGALLLCLVLPAHSGLSNARDTRCRRHLEAVVRFGSSRSTIAVTQYMRAATLLGADGAILDQAFQLFLQGTIEPDPQLLASAQRDLRLVQQSAGFPSPCSTAGQGG